MQGKYLIVDKSLLPPYCEKVAEARELLDEGMAKDVSEAVRKVGISRSTYYKYKNMVRDMSTVSMGRHAIISMMMSHRVGVLSTVIRIISNYDYSIWTINQNPPVDAKANVVITLELGEDVDLLDDMLRDIEQVAGLSHVQLLGMD
ncbi:MAG: ACT domain-containing protein [Clostridiales bacterium]|nr:ACT domain-containing protein [Candidatus Crickella caballi]